MLQTVNFSLEAALQTRTLAEKFSLANTWSILLESTIPEDKLEKTFRLAFELHESTFPITVYDLKRAWTYLKEGEEKLEIEKKQKDDKEKAANCPTCQGKGYIDVDRMNVKICDHAKQSK